MLPDQLGFAIVDEVDSILIDESRNPMIISQPRGDNGHMVITVDKVRWMQHLAVAASWSSVSVRMLHLCVQPYSHHMVLLL